MDHQHPSSSRKLGGGGSATSSSSEEINNEGLERDRTTKRCYECTFCKRGFTNSQALNGHMNIHRRDRGKAAMQAPTNPSSHNKNPDSYNHVGPTVQSPTDYLDDADHLNLMSSRFNYPVLEAQRVSTTNSKRSYECTFCKRGFTKGRALGGHMNIHRRDLCKAAKQAPTNPSSLNKNPDSYNHVGPTNQSPANYHDDDDHLNRMPSWGADLSLRTGSSNNNQVEEEIENVGSRRVVSMEDEEELDLELRLGHHP